MAQQAHDEREHAFGVRARSMGEPLEEGLEEQRAVGEWGEGGGVRQEFRLDGVQCAVADFGDVVNCAEGERGIMLKCDANGRGAVTSLTQFADGLLAEVGIGRPREMQHRGVRLATRIPLRTGEGP